MGHAGIDTPVLIGQYDPRGQIVGLTCPGAHQYPVGHGEHDPSPVTFAYDPSAHDCGVLDPIGHE